jgi:hypothetical protein
VCVSGLHRSTKAVSAAEFMFAPPAYKRDEREKIGRLDELRVPLVIRHAAAGREPKISWNWAKEGTSSATCVSFFYAW